MEIPKARTLPIAIGLGGIAIIVGVIYGEYFGQEPEPNFAIVAFLTGVFFAVAALCVWIWDRDETRKVIKYQIDNKI